ncbi:MAG: cytochrome c family protein [Pseudomonadota bacterium]
MSAWLGLRKKAAAAPVLGLAFFLGIGWVGAGEPPVYVGAEVCRDCHETEFRNFQAYSKKMKSFDSVVVMQKGLTEKEYQECLECHTTGYGRPGGFVSLEATPGLKNAGCEVCHGPGSLHVDSGDPADIKGKLSIEDCEKCHNPERVEAFNFKPLIFGGAH